jgi:hypothetical protein
MNLPSIHGKLAVFLPVVAALWLPFSLRAMDGAPSPEPPNHPPNRIEPDKEPSFRAPPPPPPPAKAQMDAEISALHLSIAKLRFSRPAGASSPTPPPDDHPGVSPWVKELVTFANSLDMKFARVGDVQFCVWDTRVRDFDAFARATSLKSNSWREPGFKQGSTHPVICVSWEDATAFCRWLTDREHQSGLLPANRFYRLPTDVEWSQAVGLPAEQGETPQERDVSAPGVYPWGKAWPPPAGAGNYTGQETTSDVAIKGYNDGYAWTSPVGSFRPNAFGLYDMGGNVWQWCQDTWNADSQERVLRGASWYNGALNQSLLSSCRIHAKPDSSADNYGFRCVLAEGEK